MSAGADASTRGTFTIWFFIGACAAALFVVNAGLLFYGPYLSFGNVLHPSLAGAQVVCGVAGGFGMLGRGPQDAGGPSPPSATRGLFATLFFLLAGGGVVAVVLLLMIGGMSFRM